MDFGKVSSRLADKKTHLGTFAILAGVVLLIGVPELRTSLNANQGAVTAVLTLLLVVLYVGQYRLLDRQVRLENRPHLVVEEYDEEGNSINVQLSNLGNGVAKDIYLETTIDFEGGGRFSPASGRSAMRKVGDEGDRKHRVGNALEAGRAHELFVGRAMTGLLVDGEYQGYGLQAATGELTSQGVESVTVDFSITCTDLLGNGYRTTIYGVPYRVEIDGRGVGVEDVIRNGSWDTPGWDNV